MLSVITQVIKTIQGEGTTVGEPVTLIRFNGCNISCSYCDSKWANKKQINFKKFESDGVTNTIPPYEINDNNIMDFLKYLELFIGITRTILLTGGEPLLYTGTIERIINYFHVFHKYEIETNGILLPNVIDIIGLCNNKFEDRIQLNISPKVYEFSDKYGDDFKNVVNDLKQMDIKHYYKFLYRQDLEDDLLSFISEKRISRDRVLMSPMTPPLSIKNFEEVFKHNCLQTVKFCIHENYRYSPREHVFLFGTDREEIL